MAGLLKKGFFTLLLTLCCGTLSAQDKSLQVNAPAMVSVGKPFLVEYSIGVQPEKVISPSSFDGFDLVAGPSASESFMSQVVNGVMTQSHKYVYTYMLSARNPGTFTIPAPSFIVEGKTHKAKTVPIEVVAGDANAGSAASGRADDAGRQQAEIGANDVLLRATVNTAKAYKGQPVRLSFKLYTRVRLSGFEETKVPSFNGFWSQELPVNQYTPQREQYNGKVYDTQIVSEYLLYPQQTGTLQIDPFVTQAVGQIITRRASQSALDDIFGGMPDVQEVRKKISSQPLTITVHEFPDGAPPSFNGAVGNFTMTSDVPKGTINVNSSATYTIRLTGTGNLPLIQAPKIDMPSSFEQYNPKTAESLNKTVSGISGYRQFEYPFIARAEGDYGIDPVQFTFFNPETSKYVTLSTEALDLRVLPDTTPGAAAPGGIMTGLTKEDLKIIGSDIRFIKLDAPKLRTKGTLLLFSPAYFIAVGLLVACFIFLVFYLRRRIEQMRNADMMRGKRANKVVLARLKAAEQYMKGGNDRKFQDEMLKALWGYMSDKLNIPVANLTKENVREELLKRNIPADHINRYIDLISECEYAQYSPAESMRTGEIYRTAVEVISKMESYIRKS